MKKLILPLLIVLVFGISIYTVTNYNKNKAKDLALTKVENSEENNTTKSAESTTEKEPTPDKSTVLDKTPALDFKLKDLNGKEVSLSDFKGKKVFLNFWASWCPPCKAEMPDIEKLYNETKNSDLIILAVNLGENKSDVTSFINDNKYSFPVLLDSDQNVAAQYNIQYIPTSFFINAEGNIIKTKGPMTLEEMKSFIIEF
ncbi:TlpA disulfide reductase family protein [Clostridium sp.]|uniref:TlpA disulfide reductase family protein n=1 Tax=Clostridium sp. TaxID=1506 RepID=UPI001A3D046F|nr:TlpA disulfide reductase family protein [Clostridium sp.]MBK5240979.1 TlpA family protein disulfide reductase [Clostridium sp.]